MSCSFRVQAAIKRATAAPSAGTLSAVDFAALAEVASESGPALSAIALECHAVASERALATVGATEKAASGGLIDTAQCSLDVDVLGPIVCNFAAALADAGEFARCARCVDRLVRALDICSTRAMTTTGDGGGGRATGAQLDPALAQRLAVTLFNRAVGLAQTPSPQYVGTSSLIPRIYVVLCRFASHQANSRKGGDTAQRLVSDLVPVYIHSVRQRSTPMRCDISSVCVPCI